MNSIQNELREYKRLSVYLKTTNIKDDKNRLKQMVKRLKH